MGDELFTGAVPRIYQDVMVPIFFAPYARELVARIAARAPAAVLEIAAGTGVVTRELAARLAPSVSIVASDLNQPMLDEAARVGTARPVTWRQADAASLPFADQSFDLIACQFGVMFFPDRPRAFAEARRVLRAGGTLLFSTWDRIEAVPVVDEIQRAVMSLFPTDPPRFIARTPHGYFQPDAIAADLARGGFTRPPAITTVEARGRADSARAVALAICQGTPMRGEIERRGGADALARATSAAEAAVSRRFGPGPLEVALSAVVVEVAL